MSVGLHSLQSLLGRSFLDSLSSGGPRQFLACGSITPVSALSSRAFLLHVCLHPNLLLIRTFVTGSEFPLIQCKIILTWLYLLRPYYQIRSHSQGLGSLGLRTWTDLSGRYKSIHYLIQYKTIWTSKSFFYTITQGFTFFKPGSVNSNFPNGKCYNCNCN